MIYEYRGVVNERLKSIPASVTGDELQRIYAERGEITPAAVVEESASPLSPLHAAFEWDDVEAAEQHRLNQARQIVRALVLVSDPAKRETAPVVRAFVSIQRPEGGTQRLYKPIVEVVQVEPEREQIQRRLRHELLALRRRYLDLIEFSEMVEVAQDVFATNGV